MQNPVIDQQAPHQAGQPTFHWPSAWQMGLSTLAIFGLWGLAGVLTLMGLIEQIAPTTSMGPAATFMVAAGLALCGVLLLPSVGYAYARLLKKPFFLPAWLNFNRLWKTIFILPVVILLGHWIATSSKVAWLLLPMLHILAIGLPIFWLLWLGLRRLPLGGAQRAWGVFGAGLVLGPTIILILEVLAAGFIFLMGSVFIASQPDLTQEVVELAEKLNTVGEDVGAVIQIVRPYLTRPSVSFTIFAFIAGVVPIIEELLKPIGVWLLINRNLTPVEGFVAGLFSGAGYALFENLALSSQIEDWAFLVTARAGTGLLHMVTSGLLGWALVQAWQKRAYARLVLAYLVAVTIHGLWNGLTLLTLTNLLTAEEAVYPAVLLNLAKISPLGLIALLFVSLGILLEANHKLRPSKEKLLAVIPESAI